MGPLACRRKSRGIRSSGICSKKIDWLVEEESIAYPEKTDHLFENVNRFVGEDEASG